MEPSRNNNAPSLSADKAKVELALRLASGEIDLEGFKMAMSALTTKDALEALR